MGYSFKESTKDLTISIVKDISVVVVLSIAGDGLLVLNAFSTLLK